MGYKTKQNKKQRKEERRKGRKKKGKKKEIQAPVSLTEIQNPMQAALKVMNII